MMHEIGQHLSDILINVGGLIKKEIILHCPKTDTSDPDFISIGFVHHQSACITVKSYLFPKQMIIIFSRNVIFCQPFLTSTLGFLW